MSSPDSSPFSGGVVMSGYADEKAAWWEGALLIVVFAAMVAGMWFGIFHAVMWALR